MSYWCFDDWDFTDSLLGAQIRDSALLTTYGKWASHTHSHIDKSAHVSDSAIIINSMIGENAHISNNAIISHSRITGNVCNVVVCVDADIYLVYCRRQLHRQRAHWYVAMPYRVYYAILSLNK